MHVELLQEIINVVIMHRRVRIHHYDSFMGSGEDGEEKVSYGREGASSWVGKLIAIGPEAAPLLHVTCFVATRCWAVLGNAVGRYNI